MTKASGERQKKFSSANNVHIHHKTRNISIDTSELTQVNGRTNVNVVISDLLAAQASTITSDEFTLPTGLTSVHNATKPLLPLLS